LLKYCRHNDPHWRHFEVDRTLNYLVWYSPSKSIRKTLISLVDIDEVVLGQKSPGFRKFPHKLLVQQSFSIRYQGNKWLDLVSMTHRDCQMWHYSLNQLLLNIWEGDKWSPLIPMRIPYKQEKSKNPIYPARDGKTWIRYVADLEKAQSRIWDLLKKSEELKNFYGIASMRKQLIKHNHKLSKMAKDAQFIGYLMLSNKNELRSIRIEIRVLTYKVSVLLKEKASKDSIFSNLLLFGSSSNNPVNENMQVEKSHFQTIETGPDCSTQSINRANQGHYQQFSDLKLTQAFSKDKKKSIVCRNRTGSTKSESKEA